ncbi:MAG: amidophosphoribosyltransferase [Bdellovibrionia bacterium]
MCGIVGLIGTPDASREAFLGLTTLQHRGQDAAGILSYDSDGFHRVKNIGLVESVFTRDNMQTLTGNMALGHARYSTIGRGDLVDVQPFVMNYPFGLGIVHNGNIMNVDELKHDLKTQSRRHLLTHSDTEIVLNLFAEGLAKDSDSSPDATSERMFESICRSVQQVYRRVNGSYSIITMVADHGMVAFRDPHGIRPLVWGKRLVRRDSDIVGSLESGEAHCLASESVALSFLGYDVVRNIEPGEVIFIDMKGKVHTRVLDQRGKRHCMFEWVYFASPESEIDGVPVYGSRIQLGKSLARQLKRQIQDRQIEADIIVPIPETSRIAAIALAEELAIPYREVLIKNRYIKRTFILDSQEKRQKAVNLKLSPVRSEIEGKRVILVDDSIVRGTTSKKIIDLVRKAGAAKVYFVSTCPPIQHPCYYGIDFPERSELIASGRSLAEIEQEMGADAVIYQDVEGLKQSITDAQTASSACSSKTLMNPCTACLDGKYPTDVAASAKGFAAARKMDRDGKAS